MGDPQATLHPHSTLPPATPSGLTPNTRSEAEAALTHNTTTQTDSAAPSEPSEAQRAYRRPLGPIRTSSTNYEAALLDAHKQASAPSELSTETLDGAGSPTFPAPGQGVVPLRTGVGSASGTGQGETVKKARARGLSLKGLARQQSWSDQDMKHLLQAPLMTRGEGQEDGYGSGVEGKGVGHA